MGLRAIAICDGDGIPTWIVEQVGLAETVCYVEWEPNCQHIIRSRIEDGLLPDAPIWDDARTFGGRPWRGRVDFIYGGIPCQPYSVAGKQRGAEDERDLWPAFARIVDEVRPAVALIENVAGIIQAPGGLSRIIEGYAALGYAVEWGVVSAQDAGAPHRRERVWIVAYAAG